MCWTILTETIFPGSAGGIPRRRVRWVQHSLPRQSAGLRFAIPPGGGRNPDSGDRQRDTSALEEEVWGRSLLKVSPQLAQPQCLKMRHPAPPRESSTQEPTPTCPQTPIRPLRKLGRRAACRGHGRQLPIGRAGKRAGDLTGDPPEADGSSAGGRVQPCRFWQSALRYRGPA